MLTDMEYIKSLGELISIESVAGIDVSEQAPFGKKSAEALDYVLNLCKEFGFRTKNCDYKSGWAEIGEGEEIVGILAHLDVVPAGNGWDYEPYALTEVDGKMYGRGVTDDKGPLMACVYAMKDLLDSGVKLNKRVRLILGQSEETGVWEDMEYYKQHEELPAYGFTPDADFPAIYGEKRLLCMTLTLPKENSGLVEINGGQASNMVADWCKAVWEENGVVKTIETEGKSAHASTPQDGENAISKAMAQLDGVDSPLVKFYNKYIGDCLNGERMGCGLKDEQSGELTMNVGTVKTTEDSIVLTIDVREPVTFEDEDVFGAIRKAASEYGMIFEVEENTPPVYMDKNGPVITKLLEVYREETGDMSEPEVIGGGTYARAMDNIIAFGPMIPGRELTEHQKNEYILKEDLLLIRKIYRKAIRALAE